MIEDIGADCYFHKGRNDHVACQDYAIVGETEKETWGVLCDGCSSSPHTDIGARILAWSAKDSIEKFPDLNWDDFYVATMLGAVNVANLMGITRQALDATLLTVRVNKGTDRWIRASLYGDGCLAIRYADGWIRGVQCCFPGIGNGTYPRYLSYSIDKDRSRQRDSVGGPGYTEGFSISPKGDFEAKERQLIIENHYDYGCPIPDGAAAVFLASDGVGQFGGVADKAYRSYQSVLQGLIGVKGYAGQFVQRRVARFLGKECSDMAIMPFDDISVVGIRLVEIALHG